MKLYRVYKSLASMVFGVSACLFFAGSTGVAATPFAGGAGDAADRIAPLIKSVRFTRDDMRRRLRNRGFENIVILNQRPPGFTVKACRDGHRYRLKVHRLGRVVSRERVGRCKGGLRPPQIRAELRARGYEEIRFLDRDLPVYVATACKNGVRYRLRLNRWSAINRRTREGRCGDAREEDKRPPEIRARLRKRGFNRITFVDRRLPTYIVRACKGRRRMELRIDGTGWVRERNRIGRCEAYDNGMKPREVREALRGRGFNRIRFTDRDLPVYVVEACRHDRRFELRLNRFARVMKKTRLGGCGDDREQAAYEPRQVREILRRRGYREISFFDRKLPRYGVTACRRGQKFRLHLNRYAEIRQRKRDGWCRVQDDEFAINDSDQIDEEQILQEGEIDPETCQSYLDALVRRDRIHFDVASASLRQRSHGLLRRVARVMNRCRSSRIEIAGHTDSDGSRDYNRDLSRRRAKTIAGFLAEQGISLRRMTAYGYGEERPLRPAERTERDKALNRRIEFTVLWGDEGGDR